MEDFFAHLCAQNATTHEQALYHPAVAGIAAGSLDDERFRFYLAQDYLFLREYVRVIARAAAVAEDLADVGWLAALLHATVSVEMGAVERLYAAFGGANGAVGNQVPHPNCRAYTDHLLATSSRGDLLVILAALLPCQWGYRDIARSIEARGLPHEPRFRGWVNEYLSPEYSRLVDTMIATLNREAACAGARSRAAAESAFAASSRHEVAFWDMVVDRAAARNRVGYSDG